MVNFLEIFLIKWVLIHLQLLHNLNLLLFAYNLIASHDISQINIIIMDNNKRIQKIKKQLETGYKNPSIKKLSIVMVKTNSIKLGN